MTVWNLDGSKHVNFYTVSGNRGTVTHDWYNLLIIEEGDHLEFEIIKNKQVITSYSVIKLELKYLNNDELEPMYVLTLVKKQL
ncbi:MAG: hypothetical protein ABI207_09385 [Crocinitomicaceae bacterium]